MINATHGTMMYGIHLITITTVDNVLREVKDRCGNIAPHWFMSNDAEQFFNSIGNNMMRTNNNNAITGK